MWRTLTIVIAVLCALPSSLATQAKSFSKLSTKVEITSDGSLELHAGVSVELNAQGHTVLDTEGNNNDSPSSSPSPEGGRPGKGSPSSSPSREGGPPGKGKCEERPSKGGKDNTASCPNFACQQCEKCLHGEFFRVGKGSLGEGLKDNCETDRKFEPGMGDWCRNQVINRIVHCDHLQDMSLNKTAANETAHACVTRIMCNAKEKATPCHAWKCANCPDYAGTAAPEPVRKTCRGKDASGRHDSWCDSNCNHNPPNCPSLTCICGAEAASKREGRKTCHGKHARDDSWCDSNCNHNPPNCPSSTCTCVTGDDVAFVSRRSHNLSKANGIESLLDDTLSGKCSQ